MIQYQILQIKIISILWQTEGRIINEILEVKGLILADYHVHILRTVALFCLTLVSRAMFSPNFISIIRSPILLFSICWYFSFSILHSVCSLLHLTFRLTCSALFSTLFHFCSNSQAFFSSLSNFYIITFSFFLLCLQYLGAFCPLFC